MPDELEVLQQLGSGQYGIVEKVKHKNSNYIMAVKRVTAIPSQGQEARKLLRDVDILVKGTQCVNIIKFYGALLWEGDLWILMELMDCSLDKFYRLAHSRDNKQKQTTTSAVANHSSTHNNKAPHTSQSQPMMMNETISMINKLNIASDTKAVVSTEGETAAASLQTKSNRSICDPDTTNSSTNRSVVGCCDKIAANNDAAHRDQHTVDNVTTSAENAIPDHVLGRIAADVVNALSYLYGLKVIHRDIKPSNILVSREGMIKLCDFGISGYLVNSVAKTYEAGCRPYMAPERIDPPRDCAGYDIKSDVWSLGITMMEVATGKYPYDGARDFFQQLKMICANEPPRLPPNKFTSNFEQFLDMCLRKDPRQRANYEILKQHNFITQHKGLNISSFVSSVIDVST
ncbi:Dual specificity mitogen-activated protein kinase kinase 6, partial [Fragariocoptes setiger]